ncbi:hypothetical protein PIB19_22625 [Sphingomonas sp. 7/4-4]|nr:hypothetical protein [Sphingomonas sp. 7/4-4]WBY07992.1 hypothetical protein PIB19_22625 [Sphingomonas sp. 7/4-4]
MVTLDGVSLNNNLAGGFKIDTTGNTSAAGVKATINNSDISANGGGVAVVVPAGTSNASLMIANSNISNNGAGIIGNGAAVTVRVSDTIITNNGNGVVAAAGASVLTFGNNLLQGNTTNGAFTGAVPQADPQGGGFSRRLRRIVNPPRLLHAWRSQATAMHDAIVSRKQHA